MRNLLKVDSKKYSEKLMEEFEYVEYWYVCFLLEDK